MFSHIAVFWTKREIPDAADQLVAAVETYLRPIPGALAFNVGRMVSSPRPVVEQSYQVGLNIIFADKRAQDDYQVHPLHMEFVEKTRHAWEKVVVYDFQ